MVNFADHVPHLPPRLWGYWHSEGEVWSLPDPEMFWLCGGQENPVCQFSDPDSNVGTKLMIGLLALAGDA